MLVEPQLNNEDDIDVNSFFDEDTDEDDGFFDLNKEPLTTDENEV